MSQYPRIVGSPGVTVPCGAGSGGAVCSFWLRPGTWLDCPPGSKLEAAILAAGGTLSPVIPAEPRRADAWAADADKNALGN